MKRHCSKKAIIKAAIESDGNSDIMAKKLHINPSAAWKHLQKPDVKWVLEKERKLAQRKAGMNRVKVYKKIVKGLDANVVVTSDGDAHETDAPDYKERREAAKLCCELMGDLDKDKEQDGPKVVVVMPTIKSDGKPLDMGLGEMIDADFKDT